MKPIKVESEEIKKAICSGDVYIQVDNRKFLLFEVDQVKEPDGYEVNDPDEEKQLLNALRDENPILDDDEINRLLGDQK
jgi:chorismate mutase